MADHLIGYIVAIVVVGGVGMGLPRWFRWRRRLLEGLLDPEGDGRHV